MFDMIREEWTINPTNHLQFDDENNALRIEDPRFPAQMADIGYETQYFFKNLGSVYMYLFSNLSFIDSLPSNFKANHVPV